MKNVIISITLVLFTSAHVYATIDTLKSTTEVEDARIYNYADCLTEVSGEDCRRYNSGSTFRIAIGSSNIDRRRGLFKFPGWNNVMPDSSKFMLYCVQESDTQNRTFFCYPLTRQWYEGSEDAYGVGDYPNPDSGVTWNHAFLDVGDSDSLSWITPGGDYLTSIVCTLVVSDTGQYSVMNNFNRILNYWDTSGVNYGCILINEDAFPSKTSLKTFVSSEGSSNHVPMLVLYYPSSDALAIRRRKVLVR